MARVGSPTVRLRPLTDPDREAVLRLNADHVELLSPLDDDRLSMLADVGTVEVVEVDGEPGGFVVTFGPGADYDSGYYAWFAQRYDDFLYLDRVVVDPAHRRRGVGHAVYDEVEARAGRRGVLLLEVNCDPPNEPSLAFHAARGFEPVGELGGVGRRSRMLARECRWPESVVRMWADDRASRELGMELLAVGPGRATVSMRVREDMVNGHEIGHGGLTFALADSAFACACNSHGPVTVAAGATIRFRSPVRLGELLVASAVERSREGARGAYDVEVRAGERLVAEFEGRSATLGGEDA